MKLDDLLTVIPDGGHMAIFEEKRYVCSVMKGDYTDLVLDAFLKSEVESVDTMCLHDLELGTIVLLCIDLKDQVDGEE